MSSFKKVFSGILAAAICGGISVGSISAAGTYKKGDINNDGIVNLNDLAAFQQFVNGVKSADGATAERLDVNRDYVINEYDKTIISSILLGEMSSTTMASVNTTNLPSQESRTYCKYTPDGDLVGSYTLNPVSNISQASPRCIIGNTDDRVPENGLEGVVNVQSDYGYNIGTAFVIDSHTILTAAHVLKSNNVVYDDRKFVIFDDYNSETNITITPVMYHIPQEFNSPNSDQPYDYAIVTVQEDLSDYINFDLGVMRDGISTSRYVYVTGFGSWGNDYHDQMYVNGGLIDVKSTGSGQILNRSDVGNYEIAYTVDTVGGDSGAPLYIYNSDGTKTVIGIHVRRASNYEYNEATRITTNILNFVFNNDNL